MKNLFILSAILFSTSVVCLADPVAVFDVRWGKGKERQLRTFTIAFLDADAPRTAENFRKIGEGWFLQKNHHSPIVSKLSGSRRRSSHQKERPHCSRHRRSRLHV